MKTHRHRSIALARNTDPRTSHMAAADAEADSAPDQRKACLDQVRRTPGRTAAEIAKLCGLERHVPSRRLPELRTAKEVENRDERACEVTGRRSLTWWPTFKDRLF